MPAPTDKLHDHALQAEEHLEQLATGIAPLDEQAAEALTKMAAVCRQIASGLAKTMKEEEPTPTPTTDEAITAEMAKRRAAAAPPA